jgi:glycosyltransferase involved in cell wall biosynthesis
MRDIKTGLGSDRRAKTSRRKKVRLCFLVQYLSIGGIETRLLKLLTHIDRDKFDPAIVCIRDDGLQAEEFKHLDVPIVTTKGLLPINRALQALHLILLLAKMGFRRFDVIVSFLPTSQPFENWAARFAVKGGSFAFALVVNFPMGANRDWNQRARLAKKIVSVSKGAAQALLHGSSAISKVDVIYNGVDLGLYNKLRYPLARQHFGLPRDRFVICCIARLAPQKRFDVLLDALEILKIQGKNIHCVIAGQDRLDGWFQETMARKGLSDMVTYLGPSKSVPELMAACDALVLTSDNEGCPNSVLEAMASGVPVVVTRSGAEEFVVDEETGFVVDLEDADAVAARIERLVSDPQLCAAMGRSARDWIAKNASLEMMLTKYFRLFSELSISR